MNITCVTIIGHTVTVIQIMKDIIYCYNIVDRFKEGVERNKSLLNPNPSREDHELYRILILILISCQISQDKF